MNNLNLRRAPRAAVILLLLAILVAGLFLRLHKYDSSLYGDEIRTRERAMRPLSYTLAHDSYPLYHCLAHGTLKLADNEQMLRLPALVAGLLGILAIFYVTTSIYNSTAGLIAAFLLAISPFHIFHSQHARYYTPLMLFAILTAFFLYRCITRPSARHWVFYSLCAFLGLMSQLVFMPALIAMVAVAAVYLLAPRNRGPLRARVRGLIVLALCSGVAVLPTLVVQGAARLPGVVASLQAGPEQSQADGAPEAHEAVDGTGEEQGGEPGERYLLALAGDGGYADFFKRFFWMEHWAFWYLLLAFGLWGLVDVLRNTPAMGAVLLALIGLAPLPFFFIPVGHWHHARYFCAAYPGALVLVSIGMCVVPTFIAQRLTGTARDRGGPSPVRYALMRCIEAVLALAILLAMGQGFRTAWATYPVDGYFTEGPLVPLKIPVHDWKNTYQYMAGLAQPEDVVCHVRQADEHSARYRALYYDRFLGASAREPLVEALNFDANGDSLKSLANEHPFSNLWFVGQWRFGARPNFRLFREAGMERIDFVAKPQLTGVYLFSLGEPTVNLASSEAEKDAPSDTAERVAACYPDEPLFGDGHVLRVQGSSYLTAASALPRPLEPTPYRLRNAGLDVWSGESPVGWEASQAHIRKSPDAYAGEACLELLPASEPASASQAFQCGLAPGRRFAVSAMMLAESPDAASITLKYDVAGDTRRIVSKPHPGGGEWKSVRLEAEIPADALPKSLVAEVRREGGAKGRVLVDEVALEVIGTGGRLDPLLTYTLSLWAKPRRPGLKGHVNLSYSTPETGHASVLLTELKDVNTWQRYVIPVIPGKTLPVDAQDVTPWLGCEDVPENVVKLTSHAFIINDFQFEPKDHPTPFVVGERLPHDEMFAGRKRK